MSVANSHSDSPDGMSVYEMVFTMKRPGLFLFDLQHAKRKLKL